MSTPKLYTNFDGMCWVVPGQRLDDVEWALRYGNAESVRLSAASAIACYRALVNRTSRDRAKIVRQLQDAAARESINEAK